MVNTIFIFNSKNMEQRRLINVDGDVYEGDWTNDKDNGYGIYTHYNWATYEGQWRDDIQNGCTLVWKPILNLVFLIL